MMKLNEIKNWLQENRAGKLQSLWQRADEVRRENVGNDVFLRGLIEISNVCRRSCLYCGIRAPNSQVPRYRLSDSELFDTAKLAKKLGYGTLVLQAGEDFKLRAEDVAASIRRIKSETGLAITLSLGERSEQDYRLWFEAGANRYLLRFETSNPNLYRAIHPSIPERNLPFPDFKQTDRKEENLRFAYLRQLREIGFEIGSGVMAGIPGQSWDDLARDISLFAELDLDMIGCGPFLPHPETPLGKVFGPDPATGLCKRESPTDEQKRFCEQSGIPVLDPSEQVYCDENLPFKVIALTRLVCPMANIPSTTAIATIDPKQGRLSGLSRGANVVMPNLTPTKYRKMYEIYPNKAASFESPEETHATAVRQIVELGRTIGSGPGTSPGFATRKN